MLVKATQLRRRTRTGAAAAIIALSFAGSAAAQGHDHSGHDHSGPAHGGAVDLAYKDGEFKHVHRADGHAPIGVMGDHRHGKGSFMLSYRFMRMGMEGNLIGDQEVSPQTIVTTVPNRFFGQVPPPIGAAQFLRVVPTEMTMDMHMFGAMYGITDKITVMGMLPYHQKEMDHITFLGLAGTNVKGTFTTKTEGIGDVSLTTLIGLYDHKDANGETHVNLLLGTSAPTGSITERDNVLRPVPNEGLVNQRLPYAMQLGSGTWDFLPGITATTRRGDLSFGAQYRGWIRMEDSNDEGYSLGDVHQGTAWMQYQWEPWVSTSLRLTGRTQDSIDGIDPNIVAPIQTANPDFYGGERVDLSFGVNLMGQRGLACGHRLAAEYGVPIHQDLNGPQMETDWTITVGWQKAIGGHC